MECPLPHMDVAYAKIAFPNQAEFTCSRLSQIVVFLSSPIGTQGDYWLINYAKPTKARW